MERGFEERRKGFEGKWAHDEELRFRVHARRNHLLGQWAAGEKGLSGAAAADFAAAVVAADLEEPGEEDVFRKVRSELGPEIPDAVIRDKMHALLETAAAQLEDEAK